MKLDMEKMLLSPDGRWLATISNRRQIRDELTIHQFCGGVEGAIQQGKEYSSCHTTVQLSASLGGEEGCCSNAISWLNNCVLVAGLINGCLDVVECKWMSNFLADVRLKYSVSIIGVNSSQSHGVTSIASIAGIEPQATKSSQLSSTPSDSLLWVLYSHDVVCGIPMSSLLDNEAGHNYMTASLSGSNSLMVAQTRPNLPETFTRMMMLSYPLNPVLPTHQLKLQGQQGIWCIASTRAFSDPLATTKTDVTTVLICGGSRPALAVYTVAPVDQELSMRNIALDLAGKVVGKVWRTGIGLIGYGSKGREEDSGSRSTKEFSDPSLREERLHHPLVLTGKALFSDEPRMVRSLSVDPSGRLIVASDNLGRVLLVDVEKHCVVRMWKGMRESSCAFFDVAEVWSRGRIIGASCKSFSDACSAASKTLSVMERAISGTAGLSDVLTSSTSTTLLKAQYLAILLPHRGHVEVWRLCHGPRIRVFHAPHGSSLHTIPCCSSSRDDENDEHGYPPLTRCFLTSTLPSNGGSYGVLQVELNEVHFQKLGSQLQLSPSELDSREDAAGEGYQQRRISELLINLSNLLLPAVGGKEGKFAESSASLEATEAKLLSYLEEIQNEDSPEALLAGLNILNSDGEISSNLSSRFYMKVMALTGLERFKNSSDPGAEELQRWLEEVWKEIQFQGSEDEVCSTTTSMIRLAQQRGEFYRAGGGWALQERAHEAAEWALLSTGNNPSHRTNRIQEQNSRHPHVSYFLQIALLSFHVKYGTESRTTGFGSQISSKPGSNRLRKSEAVLNFNNLNLNDDEGPQYQFINWMFSPFLGGIFGLHKLEALLSLFDPESLQTAFVNWFLRLSSNSAAAATVLRDARASPIHRWLRSCLSQWWCAEGSTSPRDGNSPFNTIFEACRCCTSLEPTFCLAMTTADVLQQEYHTSSQPSVGQDYDITQWLMLLRQLRICLETQCISLIWRLLLRLSVESIEQGTICITAIAANDQLLVYKRVKPDQMKEWQLHDIGDPHISNASDGSAADIAWRDWINSAQNVNNLNPADLMNDSEIFTPQSRPISLVSLLSTGGICQPSPILLACHRARWLSVGLLDDEGGLSLAIAHLDVLAEMPNKGATQLAGAIAYGIWDGVMLPEGAKGLSEVLRDWLLHREEKIDNNSAAALTLIEMARRLLGHINSFSSPSAAETASELILLEEENQQKNSCAFLPVQDVFVHRCVFFHPRPSPAAISTHQSMLQAFSVCFKMGLQFPNLNSLFGKEMGSLLLRKGSLDDDRFHFDSPIVVGGSSDITNTRKGLIREAFKSVGKFPAPMVYGLASSFGFDEASTRKLHIRVLLEEGHDIMAEDVITLSKHLEANALAEEIMQVAHQRLKISLPFIPWSSLAAMDADIVQDVRNSSNLTTSLGGSLSGLLGVLRTTIRTLFSPQSNSKRKILVEQLCRFTEAVIEALSLSKDY